MQTKIDPCQISHSISCPQQEFSKKKNQNPLKNETSRTKREASKADLVSAKFSSSRDAKPRQCSHPYSLCEARLFCEPWRPWKVLDLRWRWYLRVWVAIHFPLRRPQRRRIWVLGIRWFGPAYSIWGDPLFLPFSGFGNWISVRLGVSELSEFGFVAERIFWGAKLFLCCLVRA